MSNRMQLTLFLCGDVMAGRGVDQVLPHSCPPQLYEPVVTSALDYVTLAERANGPVPRPVDHAYVWGDALEVLEQVRPDLRIINLETSITTSEDAVPKGINYRMHPGNVPVFTAAGIDCGVLANNHVLDWGEAGLLETLATLDGAKIPTAGAGADLREARAPAVLEVEDAGRVLVFAFGAMDSGIPPSWAATEARPGVHRLPDLSAATLERIARIVEAARQPGDVAVGSIHWGGNWGYEIPNEHRRFAHTLIDRAGIDVVHGHSSHHPKGIEVYRDRLILYGCGDFLDDYEGISGHEQFRDDLVVMYFPSLETGTGRLLRLEMVPLQIRNLRLNHPTAADRAWLFERLDRECRRFGRRVVPGQEIFVLE
jgi:poly-gamma-glutamate capsule biosynthesis protein CapA/YwtB (metallophosphatase superfamily)